MVCTAVGIPWTSNVKCICNYPRWPGDQGEQRQKLLLRDSPCPPGPGSRAGSWLLESPGAARAAARAAGCAAAHCTDGSQLPCSSPGQARLTHELSRCPGRAGKEGRKEGLLSCSCTAGPVCPANCFLPLVSRSIKF